MSCTLSFQNMILILPPVYDPIKPFWFASAVLFSDGGSRVFIVTFFYVKLKLKMS